MMATVVIATLVLAGCAKNDAISWCRFRRASMDNANCVT